MIWFPDTARWPSQDIWKEHQPLLDALGTKKLVLIVGNGVSRLSVHSAPGWEKLLRDKECKRVLESQGIDVERECSTGASLLELAQVFRDRPKAWGLFVRRLFTWMKSKAQPNIIHDLIKVLSPGLVLTPNVDALLERTGTPKNKVVHLHGQPEDPNSWTFAKQDYDEQKAPVARKFLQAFPPKPKRNQERVGLFIGYGHSGEDADIIEAVTSIPTTEHALYTLMPESEATGLRRYRIERQGITPVTYPLPVGPTRTERLLGLATALESLISKIPSDSRHKDHDSVSKGVDDLCRSYTSTKQGATLAVGLASVNILSTTLEDEGNPAKRFPTHTRVSMARMEKRVLGGPGATTAWLLSQLGLPVVLVSKIATDAEGDFVFDKLYKTRDPEELKDQGRPLYIDLLERGPANEKEHHQTWRSYIIVHPDNGQRVVMDRFIEHEFLKVALFDGNSTSSNNLKRLAPREIYFDKFLRGAVQDLLDPDSTQFGDDVWNFYETGERGNERFDKSLTGKINFALCSFRHAQDYVTKCGSDQRRLIIREGITHASEVQKIENVVNNPAKLENFVKAVYKGGRVWLQGRDPAFIIVTLHEHGCLWIDLNNPGSWNYQPPETVVSKPVCTAGAGDVFRAAFLAGVKKVRGQELSLRDKMNDICRFANTAACSRISYLTLEDASPMIKTAFDAL